MIDTFLLFAANGNFIQYIDLQQPSDMPVTLERFLSVRPGASTA